MNTSIVRYVLGTVLKMEAALFLLPMLTAAIYQEKQGFAYVITALLSLVLGMIMTRRKPKNNVFYLKEGCVTTSLSWILMSLIGCLPFVMTGEIPSFVDALFETISGFTTTGASILSNVEALSHASLMWRSFTHWVGGMGVLVFVLAIVPLSGGSSINLMRAESPGPSVGKLVPKVKYTARILYGIYVGLSVIEFLFLILGRMPLFDAITTTFGTAGTGGFGIKSDSMMSYSPYIQWVVAIFMIIFGINFNVYYLILFHNFKKAFRVEELRYFLLIIAGSIAIICCNTHRMFTSLAETFRHATFQVASIISSTGFATVDFDLWPQTSRTLLVVLMLIGACAGSTGGGIKVSRIVIAVKTVVKELHSYIHPRSVRKVMFEGKPVDHDVVRSINVFLVTYMLIFIVSTLLISFEGYDFVTNLTAVVTTLSNIGPGLAKVGPTCNFSFFHPFTKFVLMFDMLAGRLELFPVLLLFHPALWKDTFSQRILHHDCAAKSFR